MILLFLQHAFAQTTTTIAASPTVVDVLQGISDKIPAGFPVWIFPVLGIVAELVMRFVPTVQPKSLFLVAAKVFNLIGGIFTKISVLLDSIVQNLK